MKIHTIFKTHQSSRYLIEKVKKTINDSENGASLSQIGRRCPSLLFANLKPDKGRSDSYILNSCPKIVEYDCNECLIESELFFFTYILLLAISLLLQV